MARAISTRMRVTNRAQAADLEQLEKAILEVERQANSLDEITKAAESIQRGAAGILKRATIVQEGIAKQVDVLNERLEELRDILGEEGDLPTAA